MIPLAVGIPLVLLGVVIELTVGSFRHWTDWSWPKREHPIAGEWLKIILGRVGTIVGLICLAIGAAALAVASVE